MKVLVTGATGFVGTNLTKVLLDKGHDVRILSRSGFNPFSNIKNIEIIKGDISDPIAVANACNNVDTVFHLAGLIGYSKAQRQAMYMVNVIGTRNIIAACKLHRCRKLVYMSSVVAVGAGFNKSEILNENSEYNISRLNLGYFETKKEAEACVKAAVLKNEIDAVILNPSTIYGPGDAKKGSRKTQMKVAKQQFPFYSSGGVNVVHIDDVIQALLRAWEVGRSGERYILCGENITIKKLFELIAKESGVHPPKFYLPNFIILLLGKVGDLLEHFGKKGFINSENAWTSILYHWFDNSKARRELGLNPKSPEQAIHDSIQWSKQHSLLK